jgi:hypothetical protein
MERGTEQRPPGKRTENGRRMMKETGNEWRNETIFVMKNNSRYGN